MARRKQLLTWLIDGKELTDDRIADYIGMVYLITNLINGKQYVGKKLFSKARTRRPLRGRSRKRRDRVESNWRTYYGSNKELAADVEKHGPEKFRREVLHLCRTKGECSYYEVIEQATRDVLKGDRWYNQWIQCKIHKTHLPRN